MCCEGTEGTVLGLVGWVSFIPVHEDPGVYPLAVDMKSRYSTYCTY